MTAKYLSPQKGALELRHKAAAAGVLGNGSESGLLSSGLPLGEGQGAQPGAGRGGRWQALGDFPAQRYVAVQKPI